ncbi:hypothetical protein ASPACDRAFT_52302 [Aspergillus aculeatus ATCC 16872]|uniref:RTA1 like protein n=1 Tax=Aspergillus aculeatus (strain ATCC 16872 / CBS 172.66 / WB 5094) TaxID=690307 RepID=A0A1L9WTQ8_ASPA1|nr:uncharacterized protein ASPACDRAFT_52302 [Aspergillus aculeatus ATCC 16872]OJJ99604.1 hypothetical protein ASPACDRAFT_52302 [Aspergillus aculeatus ATCC 16872]
MAETTLYAYTPSVTCALLALFLFLGATAYHLWLLVRKRAYFFTSFVIGGLIETIGYVARAVSAHQKPNYTVMPYALQSLFILIAPSLFAASIYMILGRIVTLTDGDSRCLIRARWMTKIFVLGDVLAFLMQCGGGGILSSAKTSSTLKLGENVIIVGLVVQILFFGFFVTVALVFHRRITANPTSTAMTLSVPWKRYLWVLYAASGLILVRCLYRVIEYAQGSTGSLQSHEAYAYVFDTALMLIMMGIFVVYHPSQILDRGKNIGEMDRLYNRV